MGDATPTLNRLSGRVAIVTGSASGIGRATAHRLSSEGASVVIADIDGDGAASVAAEIGSNGGTAIGLPVDVSDEAAIADAVTVTVREFGRLDILHNNAALLAPEVFELDADVVDLSVVVWDQIMAVNLRGVMVGTKHAIPAMLATGGGAIINTSSSSALGGDTRRAAYAASKAAIIAFTRSTATMYGKRNIRCNSVVPGVVISHANRSRLSTRQLDIWEGNCLVPYLGEPEDIAAAVAFLASDDARYITGQALSVDGGSMAHQPTFAQDVWGAAPSPQHRGDAPPSKPPLG